MCAKPEDRASEIFEYPDGSVAEKTPCPHCEDGLLLEPARFCGACDGVGYTVKWSVKGEPTFK